MLAAFAATMRPMASQSTARQGLAEDDRADRRGEHRVDAHEDAEGVGGDPAQREQVGQERHGRGQHARGGRAGQRGRRRRVARAATAIPTGT